MLFNEPKLLKSGGGKRRIILHRSFSALQRAEIAEILNAIEALRSFRDVSVLFNEPKLLKSTERLTAPVVVSSFSALQRAEIAEMMKSKKRIVARRVFQCSSTSRNC